jgi:hypothetical protein
MLITTKALGAVLHLKSEKIGQLCLLTIYAIFAFCAAVLLVGLALIVFFNWSPPSFYYYAFSIVVLESVGLLYLWIRNTFGLRTSMRVVTYNNEEEINDYMKKLISSGSTLDIVSNRLHWVSEDNTVKQKMIERARNAEINIYLPEENQIAKELRANGLHIHIIPSLGGGEHARFTLVDKNRPGSALLAVGSGRIPKFVISEFHENAYPQVVALATEYINRLGEEEKSAKRRTSIR